VLNKLAEALGKLVAAVIAGVITPVLAGVIVAEIKGPPATSPPAAVAEAPAPVVKLLPPVSAPRGEPERPTVEWRPAAMSGHAPAVGRGN
jgi:hypothetical protein